MEDGALNRGSVYFTKFFGEHNNSGLDEVPATIEIQTPNPDSIPPVLDLNRITVKAVPTQPEAPNGETQVDITFRIKDNISSYSRTDIWYLSVNRHQSVLQY